MRLTASYVPKSRMKTGGYRMRSVLTGGIPAARDTDAGLHPNPLNVHLDVVIDAPSDAVVPRMPMQPRIPQPQAQSSYVQVEQPICIAIHDTEEAKARRVHDVCIPTAQDIMDAIGASTLLSRNGGAKPVFPAAVAMDAYATDRPADVDVHAIESANAVVFSGRRCSVPITKQAIAGVLVAVEECCSVWSMQLGRQVITPRKFVVYIDDTGLSPHPSALLPEKDACILDLGVVISPRLAEASAEAGALGDLAWYIMRSLAMSEAAGAGLTVPWIRDSFCHYAVHVAYPEASDMYKIAARTMARCWSAFYHSAPRQPDAASVSMLWALWGAQAGPSHVIDVARKMQEAHNADSGRHFFELFSQATGQVPSEAFAKWLIACLTQGFFTNDDTARRLASKAYREASNSGMFYVDPSRMRWAVRTIPSAGKRAFRYCFDVVDASPERGLQLPLSDDSNCTWVVAYLATYADGSCASNVSLEAISKDNLVDLKAAVGYI